MRDLAESTQDGAIAIRWRPVSLELPRQLARSPSAGWRIFGADEAS